MTKKVAKRGTRLRGTETRKPCVDCGRLRDRFKSFKPRWAGCADHKNDKGRRHFVPGCAGCEKIVNGNIRQPRCVDCDKARSKKRPEVKSTVAAPVAAVVLEPEVVHLPVVETEPGVVACEEPSLESVQVPEPAAEPARQDPVFNTKADLLRLFDDEAADAGD